MRINPRVVNLNLSLLADVFAIGIAFTIAFLIQNYPLGRLRIREILSLEMTVWQFLLAALLGLVWAAVLATGSLYASRLDIGSDVLAVIRFGSYIPLATLAISVLASIDTATPRMIGMFWVLSIALLLALRLPDYLPSRRLANGKRRRLLVVGTGERATDFVRRLMTGRRRGYEIIGFADNDWGAGVAQNLPYPMVCDLDRVPAFLEANVVDEVLIALPLASCYRQAQRVMESCEEQGILVRCLTSPFDSFQSRTWVEAFHGAFVTTYSAKAFDAGHLFVKRAIDIIVSIVLLVVSAPVLALTALLIKLTTPGPVLFRQTRIGLNKRPFTIYKLRTMVQDAEQQLATVTHLNQEISVAFKIKNDPRITPVGSLLRKTSIDELPQLFNVLKGDMSLVGPRPLFQWEYERIEESRVRRRYSLKPGLTGPWQVSGRNDVSFQRRVELDLYYIDNWSLLLDCHLLLKTIPAVLSGRGAM